jgi:transketolase
MADVETTCINTVRCLSADMVQAAKSGHPGAPMGCAPMAHVLYGKVMQHSPSDAEWFNRDRFVLSNGHACALQYSMLHLTGYPLSIDDCKAFRQLDSLTPGHPENFATAGVEVSTGPLGQGLSNAVGMAIAESNLAATYNKEGHKIIDHFTYVICGDGCLQEGVTSEACSLAGHLGLGKLVLLYDDNLITIDGGTELSFTEDVKKRFEAYNWQVIEVADGTDSAAILAAVEEGKACTDKPTMVKIRTVIGEGCPSKQGSHKVHGAPLGEEGVKETKTNLGLDPEQSFQVPDAVAEYYAGVKISGDAAAVAWKEELAAFTAAFPGEGAELARRIAGDLPEDALAALSTYTPEDPNKATRQWSQLALNDLAPKLPELMGGSADLTPSNLTLPTGNSDYQKATPAGKYIRFGVREHGMAAICNGMAAHGGVIPYCATFLNFTGYALGAVRVSALSRFRVLYVMTHDSIGLGEDGPTHQPIEMLESLRSMPNMFVFRPCDGNEVAGSYAAALQLATAPSVLALSRQGMPVNAGSSIEAVRLGAYVLDAAKGGACSAPYRSHSDDTLLPPDRVL